jgi:hypothetical protein
VQATTLLTAKQQKRAVVREERAKRAAQAVNGYSLYQCFFHVFCAVSMASRVQFWSLEPIGRICAQRDEDLYYAEATRSWSDDYYGSGHWLTTDQLWLICTLWTTYNLWSRRNKWDGRFNDYALVIHDLATLALLFQCRFTPQHSLFFLFVHSIHDLADVILGVLKVFSARFKRAVFSEWAFVLPLIWFMTRIYRYGQFVWMTSHAPRVLYVELIILWILDVSWFIMIWLLLVRLRRSARLQQRAEAAKLLLPLRVDSSKTA